MSTILAYVDLTLLGYAAVFVATLVFSQKIKDFFAGVPTELRASLSTLEASVKADVKNYQASLIAKIAPASAKTTAPVPPVPNAPAAPTATTV